MLKFLHLSDLHFTADDGDTQFDQDREVRAGLLEDLGCEGRSDFDAILVTGDVAFHGRVEQFERANAWFEEVRAKTKVAAESFFVVPGNHDVNQAFVAENSVMWDAHKSLRALHNESQRDVELRKKLQDKSFDFLASLRDFRNFAGQHGRLCLTSADELAWSSRLSTSFPDGTPLVLHGLNSAFLSDRGDRKGNLLVSPFQFRRLAESHDGVNVVLCHHPPAWLMDGNHVEDRFRAHAHLALTGHEHQSRCFTVDDKLRICAGAVHPSRGEAEWNPGYNVIRLSIDVADRTLLTEVETRVWHKTAFVFAGQGYPGSQYYQHRQKLPPRKTPTLVTAHETGQITARGEATPSVMPSEPIENPDDAEHSAARRKLIIHFFRLGTIAKYQAAIDAGVWEEADESFEGQARWARVFSRAEAQHRLGYLWDCVAKQERGLSGEPNPFTSPHNAP